MFGVVDEASYALASISGPRHVFCKENVQQPDGRSGLLVCSSILQIALSFAAPSEAGRYLRQDSRLWQWLA